MQRGYSHFGQKVPTTEDPITNLRINLKFFYCLNGKNLNLYYSIRIFNNIKMFFITRIYYLYKIFLVSKLYAGKVDIRKIVRGMSGKIKFFNINFVFFMK